jgi:hypothetical protein
MGEGFISKQGGPADIINLCSFVKNKLCKRKQIPGNTTLR